MNKERSNINSLVKQTASRKDSHLALALLSQNGQIDDRFYYEPFLSAHPEEHESWSIQLADKTMKFPIWISSMTGGTEKTNEINKRLAETAAKFGLGMGVGSARIALEDGEQLEGFNLRPILGNTVPFYLNFGIAQIEKMLQNNSIYLIKELKEKLQADGIIIHVNPMQEWMQPEGDRIKNPPIETIQKCLSLLDAPIIIKEVGQGFGYESMKALLQLPLTAIEFSANGGTNFSKLELQRNKTKNKFFLPFVNIGHSAEEMVEMSNQLLKELENNIKCRTFIISGGIKNFLDGFYLVQKSKGNAFYGQASEFLKYAKESQEELDEFVRHQIEGLLLARAFLTLK